MKVQTYLALWAHALSLPSQYRSRTERQMRQVWATMTDAERKSFV